MPQFIMDKPKKPQFYALKVGVNEKSFKKYIMKDVFLSHITLLYKPSTEDISMMNQSVGSEIVLKSKHILVKKGVGSTLVFDSIPIYFEASEPHLTISTNGQPPAVSNSIINEYNSNEDSDIECIPFEVELKGIVCGAVYGKKGLTFVANPEWLKT